jgi:hypothetical protein
MKVPVENSGVGKLASSCSICFDILLAFEINKN